MFRVQFLEPSPGVGVLEGKLRLKIRGCTGVECAQLPQLVRSRRAAGTAEYKEDGDRQYWSVSRKFAALLCLRTHGCYFRTPSLTTRRAGMLPAGHQDQESLAAGLGPLHPQGLVLVCLLPTPRQQVRSEQQQAYLTHPSVGI